MTEKSRPTPARAVSLSHGIRNPHTRERFEMKRRRSNAERLRHAVDALPDHTKRGMLDGINSNRVIVGAYTDRRGGVCPMLAAHRNGGRTDFGSFARAWDAFTGAKRARRASAREVRTLRGYLEAALIRDGAAPPEPGWVPASPWAARPLGEEVREVQASRRRRAATEAGEDVEVTIEELLQRTHNEAVANVSVDGPDRDRTPGTRTPA